jgi:NADPH-dependent 2,4-dienoyl-CoA reductase/sulfur reductase-like enzyme/nitrite reductase/ring-hydroxylating ferredoxin subunit
MGTHDTELKGPDLADGIELSDLSDGKPLLGHARGEALVVVRRGDDVFVTGATCTHYSGPLAEGLVVGTTIRCPWHHACFSLETGEAIGAPALSPLPCYSIVRRGTKVSIGEKREPPRRELDPSSVPRSVVVLGAGAAGAAAVEALRREGYRGPLTLVGDEAPGPVDRPNLSKDYLAGTAPEEWIPLRGPEFYAELGVELVLGDRATRLDPKARRVTLESGRVLEFGACLLATGARPRTLDVPGADLPHVHVLRTLADSRAIIEAVAGKRRVVVIGASFIGLEVAASLRHRELEVDVVAPDATPLARVVGDELGRFVKSLHEEHGVRFYLGRKPTKISAHRVTLDDGTELDAEVVVTGVGVVPKSELAEAAGLNVDNGIVVDAELRTSAPGVYAAGDVARYPDPITGTAARIEHWALAERQGQAAARSMLGRGKPFADAPFFWSQHYDVTLSYVGHATSWDRIETRGSLKERDFAAAFVKGDRIHAVVTVGRDLTSLRCEAAFERHDSAELARIFAER